MDFPHLHVLYYKPVITSYIYFEFFSVFFCETFKKLNDFLSEFLENRFSFINKKKTNSLNNAVHLFSFFKEVSFFYKLMARMT